MTETPMTATLESFERKGSIEIDKSQDDLTADDYQVKNKLNNMKFSQNKNSKYLNP